MLAQVRLPRALGHRARLAAFLCPGRGVARVL